LVIPEGDDLKNRAFILLAAMLLLLPACRSRMSKDTQTELKRAAERSREIEEQAALSDEIGNGSFAPVRAPRFAPEADDMPLSGNVVDGARVIEMTAQSFAFNPDRIVVNYGDRVRLEISNDNVVHGFALWGYAIVRRLEPEEMTVVEFDAQKAGEFHFACSEYCGPGCVSISGTLYVKDPKANAAGPQSMTVGR
jgi:plastocyanin